MEVEAKLIESMADDYSNVLKEAKSMGCKEIRALYNIPIKNMEMIVQALEKQIPKKVQLRHIRKYDGYDDGECPNCGMSVSREYDGNDVFCPDCGQKLDWSDEE